MSSIDWRQLRRWGINENRPPANSHIRFRPRSVWDRYWAYIVGAAAIVVVQSALMGSLLLSRRRRQRAERHLHRSETDLRARNEQIPDLVRRLITAQEAERARIARELHDDVSQQVALLAIDLDLLAHGGHDDGLAVQALSRAHGVARSLHDLSHHLHPPRLRLTGLVSALRSLQRELSRPNMRIALTSDGVPSALPDDLALCLFRIAQEALQNATKHSEASEVSVHLSGDRERLVLTIVDNGTGFDVDTAWGKGLGLISMTERLEAFHGMLRISSDRAAGTRLEATVPLPDSHGSTDRRSDGTADRA